MAEIVLSPLLERVIGSLVSALGEQISLVWGVEEELQKLSSTLSAIHSLMADAEEKQLQSKSITDWLRKLKDVAYDAEDVVDDFNLEALQAKQAGDVVDSKKRKEVLNLRFCFCLKKVPFRHEIGNRIRDIRMRLDEIAKERAQFYLSEMSVARPIQISQAPYTSPLIDPSTVIGREEEKDKLIEELLMSNESISGKHFSVIPIQGLGGLGKTTLARFVYDNEEVKKLFEVRGWVCASDKFDSRRVTKDIVASITNEPGEVTHPEVRLKDLIDGKRFLIVIDDVWEDALKYWDDFHLPFIHGNQGSRLIVTTRSKRVSSVMGTSVPFHLGGLLEEDCLKLFLKKVFVNGDMEIYPNLVKIGEDIVKKCGGVPLAINTLGGLLTFTRNESEWNGVLESSFWKLPQDENSILPALRLSYHHLPLKVKPCFAFCSLFPKDWVFDKDSLIRMWMALGYIQFDGRREEEIIGDEYFNDLLMISFFSSSGLFLGKYTMHDLVHDLAESLAKEECIRLHIDKCEQILEKNNVPQRVRHAYLILREEVKKVCCDDVKILTRLRSFVSSPISYVFEYYKTPFFPMNTTKLHFLHILSLTVNDIHRLPNDLGCFPLLRYLDLSGSKIEELPDSICILSNLQTLNLSHCANLMKLPDNIASLKNLRYFNIIGCHMLMCMPAHFGNLTNLRGLPLFIVGREVGTKIIELKGLNSLKGGLFIECVDNVVDGEEAKEVGLKNKQLKELILDWKKVEALDTSKDEVVLENLQPHINLEKLALSFYHGTYLPSWLSNLCSLRYLGLYHCSKLVYLHEDLGKLEELIVRGCHNITSLHTSNSCSLRHLELDRCSKLVSLPEDLGKLEVLSVCGCHDITSLPRCGLPKSLKALEIIDSPLLKESCERDWAKIAYIPNLRIS